MSIQTHSYLSKSSLKMDSDSLTRFCVRMSTGSSERVLRNLSTVELAWWHFDDNGVEDIERNKRESTSVVKPRCLSMQRKSELISYVCVCVCLTVSKHPQLCVL